MSFIGIKTFSDFVIWYTIREVKRRSFRAVTVIVRLVNVFGFISAGVCFFLKHFRSQPTTLAHLPIVPRTYPSPAIRGSLFIEEKNRHRIQRFRMESGSLPFFFPFSKFVIGAH